MSKHNRERRTFREAKKLEALIRGRQPNEYEAIRMFKHGKRRLIGRCWTPTPKGQ